MTRFVRVTGSRAADLVRTSRLVLLDFDGPIARLLPGTRYLRLAEGARELAASLGLDLEGGPRSDHVQVLRHAHRLDPRIGRRLEQWCSEQERAAADRVDPAPEAAGFVDACTVRGLRVAVVTNNTPDAVRTVLRRGGPGLGRLPVHGRDPRHLERLKPAPDMLLAAARGAGAAPGQAVMVGDTVGDVRAAIAAGMPCLGLHDECERREELVRAGALGAVRSLAELAP